MPYLHKWGSRSTLIEMCQGLSQIFGEDPPVYARPASQPYHPPQPPSYNSVASSSSSTSYNASAASSSRPTPPPPSYSTLTKEPSYKASGTTNLEKLTVKIQGELQDFYNDARKEMQSDLALQTKLSSSQGESARLVRTVRTGWIDDDVRCFIFLFNPVTFVRCDRRNIKAAHEPPQDKGEFDRRHR